MTFKSVFIAVFLGTALIAAAVIVNSRRPDVETSQPSAQPFSCSLPAFTTRIVVGDLAACVRVVKTRVTIYPGTGPITPTYQTS